MEIFSALVDIFSIMFSATKRILLYLKTNILRRCLCLRKRHVIYHNPYLKSILDDQSDFVSLASMECFQKLQSFLHNYSYQIIPFSEAFSGKNIIHLGGSAANINVNSLFVTKLKNFVVICH